jgi:hypothetical protein
LHDRVDGRVRIRDEKDPTRGGADLVNPSDHPRGGDHGAVRRQAVDAAFVEHQSVEPGRGAPPYDPRRQKLELVRLLEPEQFFQAAILQGVFFDGQ